MKRCDKCNSYLILCKCEFKKSIIILRKAIKSYKKTNKKINDFYSKEKYEEELKKLKVI